MYSIWIDDERNTPATSIDNKPFDATARTTNDAIKIVRKKYKEGVRKFFLDIDNDTEDSIKNENGGEFYNVLKNLEDYCHNGKMRDTEFHVKMHTGNSVARERMRALIRSNHNFREVL